MARQWVAGDCFGCGACWSRGSVVGGLEVSLIHSLPRRLFTCAISECGGWRKFLYARVCRKVLRFQSLRRCGYLSPMPFGILCLLSFARK